MFQKTISLGLLLLTPGFLAAQDSGAMLYGTGLVYLNGSQLANSSAVAIGDVIQIKENGEANLNASGSSVMIQSSTIARFRSGGLALDRGSISVATGNGMSVFARDFKITPVTGGWTEFYVTRVSGSIQIIARKGNVTVSCGATTSTIKEGQEISRNDAADCGVVAKGSGAPAAVKPPLITSSTAKYAALGVGGGLLLWSLAHTDEPVSPSVP
jgi:ferric-dicitrate binding protein FerR (iron transport regulator)